MPFLPPDPLADSTLAGFATRLRRGELTAEAATEAYLGRIAALDSQLHALTHVAVDAARAAAREADRSLAAGVDLGPLMGVPVIVKDLFTVEGMPSPRVGSDLDVADLIEPEGTFIKRLRRAGCVILGKSAMTEFAFGLVNVKHKPPWNPWDRQTHRMPGGSSTGSAAALAAGLCAFSVGSDTGGSVRQPAALCGAFGLKTTAGVWNLDGVFPLSTTFDSIGFFTASARDAAVVFSALADVPAAQPRPLDGLRLGMPSYYYGDLASEVRTCVEGALAALRAAGVTLVPIDVSEAAEGDAVLVQIMPAELLAHLGIDRVRAGRDVLDPLVWSRIEPALQYSAVDYIRARRRAVELRQAAEEKMHGLDGWVMPTTLDTAVAVADHATVEKAGAWTKRSTRNTRPGNLFGQCGCSIPVPRPDARLPVGLQVMCAGGNEKSLLAIAQAVEVVLGPAARPNMSQSR